VSDCNPNLAFFSCLFGGTSTKKDHAKMSSFLSGHGAGTSPWTNHVKSSWFVSLALILFSKVTQYDIFAVQCRWVPQCLVSDGQYFDSQVSTVMIL
jgi:hypothetical protein